MTGYKCDFCGKRFMAIISDGVAGKSFCGSCFDKYYKVPKGTKFILKREVSKK